MNGYAAGSRGALPEIACELFVPGLTYLTAVGDILFLQVSLNGATPVDSIVVDVQQTLSLSIRSPNGPGSLRVENTCGMPFARYLTVVSPTQGAFPSGSFFGIDLSIPEVISQASLGAPFSGNLDNTGISTWATTAGVPIGLSIHAVTVQLDATGLPLSASPPILYVTP